MPEHHFPLHPAQQDVYMDQLLNIDSPQYNIGGYIVLKGDLNKEKFHEAVNSVPQVFDAFKMRFDLGAQDLLCHYDSDYDTAGLSEMDFSEGADPAGDAKEWMQEGYMEPNVLFPKWRRWQVITRKVQPEGPYYLAGYCLGAQIAFEMAQQLTDQGQKVAMLASFNGISPIYSSPSNIVNVKKSGTVRRIFGKTFSRLKNVVKLPLKKKFSYIHTELKIEFFRGSLFLPGFKAVGFAFRLYRLCKRKAPQLIARTYVNQSLYISQSNYKIKTYPGSMLIFRSPAIYKDPYLGWKGFVEGEIKTFDIPGMHKTRRDIMR